MPEEEQPKTDAKSKSAYGKRPLWQWIVLYVVVGGILYWLAYHFIFGNRYGAGYQNTSNTSQSAPY